MIKADFIGIAGDWHGNVGHALLALEKLDFLGVKYVFQLGDFGFYGSLLKYSTDKLRHRVNRLLERNDQYLFVTFGNHENYDLIAKVPMLTDGAFAGFRQEPEAPRIFYFERGQSITIGNRNFLSCGGAASIDYKWRFLYNAKGRKVWWEQERISVLDIENTVAEAEKLGHVDVFLAHDVFASAPIHGTHRQDTSKWDSEELAFAQTSRDALEKIARRVLPNIWLHGHYHNRIETEVELSSLKSVKNKKGKFITPAKTVKTYCFAKDESKNSIGVLFLDDLSVEYIE